MEFSELVKLRQSTRAYRDIAVEREKFEQCLEAGRLSPSANNAQSWTFVVVEDVALMERVAGECHRMGGAFVRQAPVIIALVAERSPLIARLGSAMRRIDFTSLDMGIAATHICLQAADLGLGSCMLESFDEKGVKQLLDIPDGKRIALLITLGYAADEKRMKRRKTTDEVIKWNKYHK